MWLKNLFKRRKKQEKDPKEGVQTFKEFIEWSNERAADGFWGMNVAMICIDIHHHIKKFPFWKREKEFQKLKDELNKEIIITINELIDENNKNAWKGLFISMSTTSPCDYIAKNLKDAAESLKKETDEAILTYLNETEEKEND